MGPIISLIALVFGPLKRYFLLNRDEKRQSKTADKLYDRLNTRQFPWLTGRRKEFRELYFRATRSEVVTIGVLTLDWPKLTYEPLPDDIKPLAIYARFHVAKVQRDTVAVCPSGMMWWIKRYLEFTTPACNAPGYDPRVSDVEADSNDQRQPKPT